MAELASVDPPKFLLGSSAGGEGSEHHHQAHPPMPDLQQLWRWTLAAIPSLFPPPAAEEVMSSPKHLLNRIRESPQESLRVLRLLQVPHAFRQDEFERILRHKEQLVTAEARLQALRGLLWSLVLFEQKQLAEAGPEGEEGLGMVVPGLPQLQILDALVRSEVEMLQRVVGSGITGGPAKCARYPACRQFDW